MAWHANVLVVANVTATSDDLLAALRARAEKGPISAFLLMPATRIGFAGREESQGRLNEALEKWRAAKLEADGAVGDADPVLAVQEAWDPGRFDEVIVSTLPGQTSKWLQFDLPHRVARLTGVQVLHVTAMDMRPEPPHGPPPVQERAKLGPLSVLAWGGKPREGS